MKIYKSLLCIIYALFYVIVPACCIGLLICGYQQLVFTFGKLIPAIAIVILAVVVFIYNMRKGGAK